VNKAPPHTDDASAWHAANAFPARFGANLHWCDNAKTSSTTAAMFRRRAISPLWPDPELGSPERTCLD
jgi:CRISPR/Cas system endoribonuclease Cas6 (RAMP superfamily)